MQMTLRTIFCLFICFLQTGCLTGAMLRRNHFEFDKIYQFLIADNKSTFLVIGERAHYVFPLSTDLGRILSWSGSSKLNANFYHVNASGEDISGHYYLQADGKTLSPSERSELTAMGFSTEKENTDTLTYSAEITGKRYDAGKHPTASAQSFNKPYHLQISEKDSAGVYAGKLALTPVMLAADGVLIIGGITFLSIYCTAKDIMKEKCLRK